MTTMSDPAAAPHFAAALRMYREQVEEAFVLDTALPRSPWWLIPGLGDALVDQLVQPPGDAIAGTALTPARRDR